MAFSREDERADFTAAAAAGVIVVVVKACDSPTHVSTLPIKKPHFAHLGWIAAGAAAAGAAGVSAVKSPPLSTCQSDPQ